MSEELIPCPFCGEQVFTPLVASLDDGYTRCISCGAEMQRSRWQTRPIEDALNARIAELEMKIRHNALWQASEDAEERAHLEKLVPDLKKRIAELEKAYRWISTTENPPPEDKRFVLAVNATNGKTYYFVLPDLNDSSDNAG